MAMQSQDIIRKSATNGFTPAPRARDHQEEVAKLREAAKNPLWNELDFVANDHIVTYEMEMTYGSPSGQLAFLDVVEKALGS